MDKQDDHFSVSDEKIEALRLIESAPVIPNRDMLALQLIYHRVFSDDISSQQTSALKKAINTVQTKFKSYFDEGDRSPTDVFMEMTQKSYSMDNEFKNLAKHAS